ncbi:MAG: hypothetical protein IKF71_00235 [Bacilli bacterium]|nr:hypothetical protein [Bacilli bacterium]
MDIIKNNTECLVDQDIVSVLKKPPLDSMDSLRMKLLELAKKNQIVFHTEKMDSLLDSYRIYLLDCCEKIKRIRISPLKKIVEGEKLRDKEIVKITKKDFMSINKNIKKELKERFNEAYQKEILGHFTELLSDSVEEKVYDNILQDFTKYYKGPYQKQLIESCELKILVKDTTLMNAIKEQGDRYLFTLEHSRLLNDRDA